MPVQTSDKTSQPGVTVERLGMDNSPNTPTVPLSQAWEAYVKAGESGSAAVNAVLKSMYDEIMELKGKQKK